METAAERPAPFGCAGPSPESEAETKALIRLCLRENFRHSILLHGYGQRFFWSGDAVCFQKGEIPLTAKVLAGTADYALSEKVEPLQHGTFPEWFSSEFQRSAFEIAAGKYPTIQTNEAFDEVYREIEEMLVLSALL